MQTQQSCFARMLDVRGYVIAARHAVAGAPPVASMLMVIVFGMIALCLLPIWLTFDLGSTWSFTTGMRAAAAPAIGQMTAQADDLLQMSVGALLTGVIFTGFTLLPSLFELAFPTVAHPLLSLVLWCSIVFDYVTDWGKAWELVGTWTDNRLTHVIGTVVACAFFSVFVQALLVVCLTVVVFSVVSLLGGGRRHAEAVIVSR